MRPEDHSYFTLLFAKSTGVIMDFVLFVVFAFALGLIVGLALLL